MATGKSVSLGVTSENSIASTNVFRQLKSAIKPSAD